MENYLHDIDWIERYLDRSLNAQEKKEMERKMREDADLKNKFLEYREVIEGIRYAHLKEKLDQLKALEGTLPGIEVDVPAGKQRWMGIPVKYLAAAATLAVITISYFLFNRPDDPAKLYAKYFVVYPNVFEPTVRGAEALDKRASAFNAYDQGNYQQAATQFEELLKEKEEAGILLLLGNANLILDRTELAQNNFLTLIKDFDEYDAQAKWYLALTYLKQGQRDKARLILQELGDPKDTYSKKAQELLKEVQP